MNIREIAVTFIKSLEPKDREALKTMVLNGIQVAHSFAEKNGVTSEQITNELKAIYKE